MIATLEKQDIPFIPLQGSVSKVTDSLFHGHSPSVTIVSLNVLSPASTHNYAAWLHPQETKQLSVFKYNKRATEWLGGRICAKQALTLFSQLKGQEHSLAAAHGHRIESEESGRPFFSKQSSEQKIHYPQLSISHSKEFATALCATSNCGIDIQYHAASLLRVKEKFLNTAEEQLLDTLLITTSKLARLSLLWAAKEAVKKMLSPTGMPGFHDLRLERISPEDGSSFIFHLSEARRYNTHFAVAVGIQSTDYSIALCCASNTP